MTDRDLDSILDDALDDFDREETLTQAPPASSSSTSSTPANPAAAAGDASSSELSEADLAQLEEMKKVFEKLDMASILGNINGEEAPGENDERFKELQNMFASLASAGGDPTSLLNINGAAPSTSTSTSSSSSSSSAPSTASSSSSSSASSSAAFDPVSMLSQGMAGLQGMDPSQLNSMLNGDGKGLDEMFTKLMADMGSMGLGADSEEGFAQSIEKMMGEMISKEHLYPVMKQISDQFPAWLSENKGKVSGEEFENFEKQMGCFQRICEAFEKDPPDTQAVLTIMQEMQSYGPPPKELTASIMPPGLDLNEQGLPDLSALANSLPPGLNADLMKEFSNENPNGCPTM